MSKINCPHLGSPEEDPMAAIQAQEVSSGGAGSTPPVGEWQVRGKRRKLMKL